MLLLLLSDSVQGHSTVMLGMQSDGERSLYLYFLLFLFVCWWSAGPHCRSIRLASIALARRLPNCKPGDRVQSLKTNHGHQSTE